MILKNFGNKNNFFLNMEKMFYLFLIIEYLQIKLLQVGSICILVFLDVFFEYMDLVFYNSEWFKKDKINISFV